MDKFQEMIPTDADIQATTAALFGRYAPGDYRLSSALQFITTLCNSIFRQSFNEFQPPRR